MAGERRQKRRIEHETPRKPRTPERFVIGSSSTWRGDELERFLVRTGEKAVVARGGLVPEKWFDFGKLKQYQASLYSLYVCLMGSAGSFDFYTT